MAQPFFSDLGKQCNGLLSGGYVHNSVKVDVKCKTDSDVAFNFGAAHNLTTKMMIGNLEAKYKFKERNVTFAEKWSTTNMLGSEVTLEDYFTKNTKLSGEFSMQPVTKMSLESEGGSGGSALNDQPITTINKSFKAKGAYKNDYGTANLESEVNSKGGPFLKCGASLGHNYFTTGFGLGYDLKSRSFTDSKIGCQLRPDANDDLVLCLWYSIASSALITSGYTKQGALEGGYTAQWSFTKRELSLELGTKYQLNDETSIRAKIDDKAGLAFGFTRTMNQGFNITLSAMMNCLTPFSGSFQLGGAFEINL